MKCVECNVTLKEGVKLKNPRGKYLCRNCFGKLNPSRSRVWCVVGHYIAKSKAKVMSSLTGRSFYVCRPHYQEFASKWRNPDGLYEAFHGTQPTTRRVELPVPNPKEHLVAIGRLESLIYKPFGSSGLKGKLFEHQLGDDGNTIHPERPILATDSKGKNLYIVPDKAKTRVTERGIIK